MTTITKPTRAKRRTFKDVAATAHAKGLDEGYAKAAQHYEYVQEELLAEIKALQARLGKVTVLLGRNGVGKTTLLKSLMGLVPIRTGNIQFDGKAIQGILLNTHNIEVGGGLGPLSPPIWRIGMMGVNANRETADRVLAAFDTVLPNGAQ